MKRFYRRYVPAVLLLLFLAFGGIRANVSKSLRDSLLYESSGNYLWSMWDYQTNPYLYSYNQKNSLSSQMTEGNLFSFGLSFLIVSQPIYLGVQFQNGDNEVEGNKATNNLILSTNETEVSDLRLLIGTLPFSFVDALNNLGVGFFVRAKKNTSKTFPNKIGRGRDPVVDTTRTGDLNTDPNRNAHSRVSYGIELGQAEIGGTADEWGRRTGGVFSYSLGVGYHNYGEPIDFSDEGGVSLGKNTAPFLEFTTAPGFRQDFSNLVHFGPKKKEWTIDFLAWFVLTPDVNVGLAYSANIQPGLTGLDDSYDTRIDSPNGKGSSLTIEAGKHVIEPFFDLDFRAKTAELDFGKFRLSPSLQFSSHTENAVFDEELDNGTVDNSETIVRIKLAFKYYFYFDEKQTFRMVAGWAPHFNLYHVTEHERKGFPFAQFKQDSVDGVVTYKEGKGFLSSEDSLAASARFGFEIKPSKDLSLQVGFSQVGDTDSRFDLSKADFGIDYAF